MTALVPALVVASDLRALKNRVNAQVGLIDAIVRRTRPIDVTALSNWRTFAASWRALFTSADEDQTGSQMRDGQAHEDALRGLKSLLSSQCFGIPAPAPKRDVPLLPTWVTPDVVRVQKVRVAARVRALGLKAMQSASLDPVVRGAWLEFTRAWSTFESEDEAWTHCAAQYRNALAFEDVLPEWEEAIDTGAYNAGASPSLGGGWPSPFQPSFGPPTAPGVAPGFSNPGYAQPLADGWPSPFQPSFGPTRAPGVAPGLPSPTYALPAAAAPSSNGALRGTVIVIGAAAVVVAGIFLFQDSNDE